MPLYSYCCRECSTVFEECHPCKEEHPIRCRVCGGKTERVLLSEGSNVAIRISECRTHGKFDRDKYERQQDITIENLHSEDHCYEHEVIKDF